MRYLFVICLAIFLFSTGAIAQRIESRSQNIGGVVVGEVIVDGQVPLRMRYSAGGLTPAERASVVAQRLSAMPNLRPEEVVVRNVNGQWAVVARNELIVTADGAHAAANNTTTYNLALAWRNQLRSALLGQPVIPPPPTGTGTTPPPPIDTAQKVVPILSVGSGLRVGAALVAGESRQVGRVRAVAQIEAQFGGNAARVRALVPIESENIISNIRRVPGTAVIAVADIGL